MKTPTLCNKDTGNPSSTEWDDDKENHREKERHPRDGDAADAQQQTDDGNEGCQDDQVVGSDLHKGVGGIPFGKVTPYEYHRRTGGRSKQYGPCKVLSCCLLRQNGFVQHEKEEQGDEIHRERLDEPVGHPGDNEALGVLSNLLDTVKVNLEHHRVDHEPDENGYRDGDIGIFKLCQEVGNLGHIDSYCYSQAHAQQYPEC